MVAQILSHRYIVSIHIHYRVQQPVALTIVPALVISPAFHYSIRTTYHYLNQCTRPAVHHHLLVRHNMLCRSKLCPAVVVARRTSQAAVLLQPVRQKCSAYHTSPLLTLMTVTRVVATIHPLLPHPWAVSILIRQVLVQHP